MSREAATTLCATAAALGLVAAATVGAGALIVGVIGLADGLLYDLRLKHTPLAWTAFAAGIGLLPLYAWYGARGSLPTALPGVVVMAVVAGAALALANAYADLESDRRSGIRSIAVVLGGRETLLMVGALQAVVQVVAVATTLAIAGATPALLPEGGGCGLAWLAFWFAAARDDRVRLLVWELQALGILVLGAAWLSVMSSTGMMGA